MPERHEHKQPYFLYIIWDRSCFCSECDTFLMIGLPQVYKKTVVFFCFSSLRQLRQLSRTHHKKSSHIATPRFNTPSVSTTRQKPLRCLGRRSCRQRAASGSFTDVDPANEPIDVLVPDGGIFQPNFTNHSWSWLLCTPVMHVLPGKSYNELRSWAMIIFSRGEL